MAASVSLSTTGSFSGFPDVSGNIALATLTLSSPNMQRQTVTLNTGANSFTIPAGVTVVILEPPNGNNATLTLKGISGDTGILLSRTYPSIFTIDGTTPPSSFVITAGSGVTGFVVLMF